MIFGLDRKKNIFLLQHYQPIRHIHCQIAASEFLTDFDSWDMLTIIGSRSPLRVFTIYGHGGHLGHVTSIMSSDFHFLVPESFHTKFGSDQHRSF